MVNSAIKAFPELKGKEEDIRDIYKKSYLYKIDDFNDFVDKNPELFNDADSVKRYAGEIDNLIEHNENANELTERLQNIENTARRDLKDNDLNSILVISDVVKSSSKFWFPREYGGTGQGEDYNRKAFASRQSPTRRQFARADGLGAGISFLVLAGVTAGIAIAVGSGGLATPAIAIIMEIVGVGISSALSSLSLYIEL